MRFLLRLLSPIAGLTSLVIWPVTTAWRLIRGGDLLPSAGPVGWARSALRRLSGSTGKPGGDAAKPGNETHRGRGRAGETAKK